MNGLRGWLNIVTLNSKFNRSVATLVVGTALGQALVVVASPIITRLYSPQDFGVLAVYASILSTVVVVASLRYEIAIPLAEDNDVATSLLVLSLVIVLGTSLLFGLGLWLLGDHIVNWLNTPTLQPYLWLLPLGFLGAGVYQVLTYWAIRREAFTDVAKTKLSQGLALVITQVGMGLLKAGPVGLLLGDVLGRSAGSGTLATLIMRRDRMSVKQVSLNRMGFALIRYRRFPLLSSGSALLNSAGLGLPAILLAALYGPQVAGWFALGERVLGIPSALIGRSVSQVYMGEASRLARESPAALRRLYFRTARNLLLVGLLPALLLAISGPRLFTLVFGDVWRESGVYIQVLAVMFLVQFIVAPLSQTLNVLERQDLQLIWDMGRLVLVVGALVGASSISSEPIVAVALFSAAMIIAYASLFAVSGAVATSRTETSRNGRD